MVKNRIFQDKKSLTTLFLTFVFIVGFHPFSYALDTHIQNDTIGFNTYKGKVIDSKTKKELIFATLIVNETNISTVTNTQGEFLLKIPKKYKDHKITISFLGYTSKVLSQSDLINKKTIKLETYIEELSEVEILIKDVNSLISKVFKKKGDNYSEELTTMTAFYRETIKKRRSYVSLSEAVVEINKQSYTNSKKDILQLYKSRKNTDYSKLDTVVFKLRGGPFNTLFIDIMKNPTLIFTEDMFEIYDFSFDKSTKIDNRPIYVVNFKQKAYEKDPFFYGKLYIDAQSFALTNAKFSLNLEDQEKASKYFIVKKPRKAKVNPIEATYQIDYREKNGKWYYGYSRIQLGFKINWDKKLFNTVYHTTIEMAVTDWEKNLSNKLIKSKDRLKSSVIISDEASGFSDPEFWGEYNVIEPEKPIENAIKKIQKQLKKT
ncbi:carboxypeptidase-like regulatory domain-containing protein [uncultured Lutibacter sp.]|uniref:carboxypeptidase-like regulatory domain-containing protein n=1 Tax=uncultured Lutibacter sp. TaxID=437739 RepID=UPI002623454F|nr:carboxypeptidase-like regulatory domain-containing protein [uncultured Lutibacter sp.]